MRHRVLLTFSVLFLFLLSAVNGPQKKEPTCLDAYKKEFDERGAYTVDDGKYTGVIIAITNPDGSCDCVYGKVAVEGGFVITIWLQYEDNTYEYLDRKWKNNISRAKINNGITEPLYTTTNETVNVIFVDKIKPKKKQLKKVNGPGNNF